MSDEFIQPSEQLLNLGVSLPPWEERVKSAVQWRIDMESRFVSTPLERTLYVISPTVGADEQQLVHDTFDKQVEQLIQLHQEANGTRVSKTPVFDEKDMLLAKGCPLVHFIFSKDIKVGARELNGDARDRFSYTLEDALEKASIEKPLVLDFTDTTPDNLGKKGSGLSIPTLLKNFADKHDRRLPMVIVDGYGEHASELGFYMFDNFGHYMSTLVIRASAEQIEADSGYGSHWIGKFARVVSSKDGVYDQTPVPDRSFDAQRFTRFARALDHVLEGITGSTEKRGIQAPNNFGKTTALAELQQLLPAKQGILLARIDENGVLRGNNGHLLSAERLEERKATTLVVDEAGREQIPDGHAQEHLKKYENSGGKVVRIFPGNVIPSEEYKIEVIE
ncbi:hypothetical protein A3F59_02000 [Candidatus Roizmanbacteria bacterium RIFCSPHIGHO2_12_FULL_38_13]|nr:MAG: hypothetical protein A2905_03830 [Candidatus Levybacteria bacterium RIFCSPLOWO2_01_FULL_36_10]OGK35692.1 MAG: hypothetical protein A3F59_02000 [Candidatus Roizmanbacteria bacterium RIFCSPHIGHO2_12_FULL_38_13]